MPGPDAAHWVSCKNSLDASQQMRSEPIDWLKTNAMLHCKMMRSSKGGFMFVIPLVFLVGTLALTLMIAFDTNA